MPRGIDGTAPADLVERFYAAFNAQELDDFVTTLHPEVELHAARGVREGREEARRWAAKTPAGGLEQWIVVEEVRPGDCGRHAVALVRKQWWWRELDEGSPADDRPEAALFTFRDGRISRWQPFDDRTEALARLEELAARC